VKISDITSAHQSLVDSFSAFDPLRLATAFCSLLARPELQSNTVRLEVLVHLAFFAGRGRRKPNAKDMRDAFESFSNSWVGMQEDPAEDVLVSVIVTPRGNFRVLEGVWESGSFYLQRIMNIIEMLPDVQNTKFLKQCAYALLGLSDAFCGRFGLSRYDLGNEVPLGELSEELSEQVAKFQRLAVFTTQELAELEIDINGLAVFGFNLRDRAGILNDRIGHSSLERFPLAYRARSVWFLHPTAVTSAIRRFVFESFNDIGLRKTFASMIAYEHAQLFSGISLFGALKNAPIEFKQTENGLIAGATAKIERGVFINLVFLSDDLANFEADGFIGFNPKPDGLSREIDSWVDHALDGVRGQAGFKHMITMIVGCGIGRAVLHNLSDKLRDNWSVAFISAPDLHTLSSIKDFDLSSLWSLLTAERRLADLGITLFNFNGLLNLIGWARSLDGHLVPHHALPSNFGDESRNDVILVQQNALRNLRHEVMSSRDFHCVPTINGEWLPVFKDDSSFFREDRSQPLYFCDSGQSEWPLQVYESTSRWFWCELITPKGEVGGSAYERSKMLRAWICRVVPRIEPLLPGLPTGAIHIRVNFTSALTIKKPTSEHELATEDEARASIISDADSKSATVNLRVGEGFERAVFHHENIAERAFVDGLIQGLEKLANQEIPATKRSELLISVIPNLFARQTHAFVASKFRDFVREYIPRSPLTLRDGDGAIVKLGLGWRARNRELGGDISGKQDCTGFLNATVKNLEDEICADLRHFDRLQFIRLALINHEAAAVDRDNWVRTGGAVLALHSNEPETRQTMAEHDARLNAIFQATRLLIEIAICECPVEGGISPDTNDLARSMNKILMSVGLGGWSDAMYWDAMEPIISVTPLGDVQAKQDFHEKVLEPYGRLGSQNRFDAGVRDYPKNLREAALIDQASEAGIFTREFKDAWAEESGASLDVTRKFVDFVEDIGIKAGRPILYMPESSLLEARLGDEVLPREEVRRLIDFWKFEPRESWRDVPDGYRDKDIQLWRFRRRLSILRKPILKLGMGDGIIVAPGILRDAFAYMAGNYYNGDFPAWQLKPKMLRWSGKSRDRLGKKFTQEVAARVREMGWQVECEVRLTKLLRRGFAKDFGDIDVLAWKRDVARVLLIECKDVQYRKTDGEIAEQLADFRGDISIDTGKPDLLRKHLDRFDQVSAVKSAVQAYIGSREEPSIEAHLVFKNPVPMQFAWDRIDARISLHLFDTLADSLV
jgi:hypothetical protein